MRRQILRATLCGVVHFFLACVGICTHPRHQQILRRGREDGRMGFECMACGKWWPLNLGRSALSHRLARQQRQAVKRRVRAREEIEQLEEMIRTGVRP